MPPAARPDFQLDQTTCTNSSDKCKDLQQAKQESYRKYRTKQLAHELGQELSMKSPSTKRSGLQLFQLLTSRFRRRASRPECAALERVSKHLRTIAIVGNGPISAQQRKQIQHADVVIRFNKLNNRWAYANLPHGDADRLRAALQRQAGSGDVNFTDQVMTSWAT